MNQAFIQNSIANVMPAAIATGLFVSLATFQQPSQVFDSAGAWDGTYSDVNGLVAIPCMRPPYRTGDSGVTANESREPQQIVGTGSFHVLLSGLFPQVIDGWRGNGSTPGPWRVVIDGSPYELAGAESDSQGTQTRLLASVVTL